MNDNDNDNVIQLFPKDLPHIVEGKLTYNPHRIMIRDGDGNLKLYVPKWHKAKKPDSDRMKRIKRSLEKINQFMQELKGGI